MNIVGQKRRRVNRPETKYFRYLSQVFSQQDSHIIKPRPAEAHKIQKLAYKRIMYTSMPVEPERVFFEDLKDLDPDACREFLRLCDVFDSSFGTKVTIRVIQALSVQIQRAFRAYPVLSRVVDCKECSLLWRYLFLSSRSHLDRSLLPPTYDLIKWIIEQNPHALAWKPCPLYIIFYQFTDDRSLLNWVIGNYDWIFANLSLDIGDPLHFEIMKSLGKGPLPPKPSELLAITTFYKRQPHLLIGTDGEGSVFHEILSLSSRRLSDFDGVASAFMDMAKRCPPECMTTTDISGMTPLHHACDLILDYDLVGVGYQAMSEIGHFLVVRCPQAILIEDAESITPLDYLIEEIDCGVQTNEADEKEMAIIVSLTVAMLKQLYTNTEAMAEKFGARGSDMAEEVSKWLLRRLEGSEPATKSFILDASSLLKDQSMKQQQYGLVRFILESSQHHKPKKNEGIISFIKRQVRSKSRGLLIKYISLTPSSNPASGAYTSWAANRLIELEQSPKTQKLDILQEIETLKRKYLLK